MPDIFAPSMDGEVKLTSELTRIARIPRRVWSPEQADRLADELTDALKTPKGTMRLRPIQAVSLYEIGMEGGLFGVQRVGAGKTLVSLLAPVVCLCHRPLLLIPAKLLQKTERDRRLLEEHWQIPEFLRIMTYEWLGRVQASEALEQYMPDIIIADESHKLRNLKAAVTRRVRRHMAAYPQTKFVAVSGTVTKRSLHDYAHQVRWCLAAPVVPVPRNYEDLELWADALDERKGQTRRVDPGHLKILCNEEEAEDWDLNNRRAARSAFRRRLIETAGVVATYETNIDATLTVNAVECEVGAEVDAAFGKLRKDWETPDGWPISDGLAMFQHARELALGFYYLWAPRPPIEWLQARKAWCSYVRQVLKHSRTLDSELQVRRAHPEAQELLEWKAIQPSFIPNTVPVWLSDSVLKFCAQWAQENQGIVWVEHVTFGERLSELSGLPYYARKGLDKQRRSIEDHPPGTPLIASIQSNAEGRNLQAWSSSLIVSPPANGVQWEQLLGRLHRDGQEADEVQFDVLTTCAEHVGAVWQAHRDCEYVQASTGSPQKLLLAGLNVPRADEVLSKKGARWRK